MSLREEFQRTLSKAVKSQDDVAAATMRLVLAALHDRDVAARTRNGDTATVSDGDILNLLGYMVSQREESAGYYDRGGMAKQAERERREINVIREFLPAQLEEEEMKKVISDTIVKCRATSLKDLKKVMSELKQAHPHDLSHSRAAEIVREMLV